MPWYDVATPGRRKKPELGADLTDLWNAVRAIQTSTGGISSTVANIALTISRTDARHEAKMAELDRAVGRLEAVASALAHTIEQLGGQK